MKVAIIGLGWLGMPLAEKLTVDGHEVNGTKRKVAEGKLGIQILPFNWGTTPLEELEKFILGTDVLVFDLTPSALKTTGTNDYAQQFLLLVEKTVKRAVLVSSTGVFGDASGVIDENTVPNPETESGRFLLEWEAFWAKSLGNKSVILRAGGLVGSDRHPIHYLKGRTGLKNPNHPINLVYQDDVIGIIQKLIEMPAVPAVCHAVAPLHPSRRAYYTWAAEYLHLPKPTFDAPSAVEGKLIHAKLTAAALNYKYLFDDPFKMC